MAEETSEKRDEFDPSTLNHAAAVATLKDFADEIRRIASKETVNPEDEAYLAELTDKFDATDSRRKQLEREALVARVDVASGLPTKVQRGHSPVRDLDDDPFGEPRSVENPNRFANPWDENEVRHLGRSTGQIGAEYRARALSAIEKMAGTNAKRREAMTKIIETSDDEKGTLSLQALRTSSPEYIRAFAKLAQGKQNMLTPAEVDAVDRAMSLTDNAGGYLVPFQLDPTVIITSDGSYNPIRQAARKVIATGDVWNGVSSGAVSWSWDGEVTEASDDATTFAQPAITIYKGVGFVPISLEAMADAQNVAAEVGRLLAFGKETLENTALATGSGSAPQGIVTALAGTASEVAVTTANTFGLPDVYKLDEQLPARYRTRASWAAHRVIYNDIRQFDTAGGAAMWERLGADVPGLLLGRPALEVEAMDSTYGANENYCLIFGDFDNYVIADRIGTTVEFIPHLFATGNNRPSGQRGWFAYFRMGADSVNDGAFRLLNIT
jgi:HK97 family phage major capsid protein